ncbi:exopolysaccharide Pel transporter PelG [Devosia sp. XJ19-1]|uniref:Exopolysaccharide Pel transporter PelG n=1 Tax=Devosia ureilytica TaxID=2952754 RepID=A0A9Q4FSH6_9HYPH|nr:exopolysaccharide Pel transporter PelG [Devosia ureilytica]MCP8883724.1 exopolysaccharide Pel transporter PelG [Devosia ureilytica]MCP8887332.1 exopolysaccharide Pel transporter PelG [Devosia ureilytica]
MAGIGFSLKKLSSQDNLASRSLAGGHAILISSGPWIVIMCGLALLHVLGRPILDPTELKVFSILVIYSFALSLVITSPISLEVTLRVSRILFQRQFHEVRGVYLAALFITTVLSLAGGMIVFFGLIRLPLGLGLAALICVIQVSHLWLAMAFVAAIKQYAAVTTAFALGLSCSVVFGTAAASLGYGSDGMLLGFSVGLTISFCILNFLILRTFPGPLIPLYELPSKLRSIRPTSKVFLAAGVVSALAVWIDKLIVWNSGEATAVGEGLLYAVRYDSPMFMAYLSVVPVMSILVVWLETNFFDNYRHYRDIVHSGGTLRQIEAQRASLAQDTVDTVFTAFLVQLTISAVLAVIAPFLASLLGLPYDAISVLRLALIGAAFHFLFQASCGVTLFVQYGKAYLWLQVLFLVLNAAGTALMLRNPDYLGLGYVLAAMISGILAYAAMRHTLGTLNRLTFVVNNPAVSG